MYTVTQSRSSLHFSQSKKGATRKERKKEANIWNIRARGKKKKRVIIGRALELLAVSSFCYATREEGTQ